MNIIMLWVISGVLAVIPAVIWLYIIFSGKKSDKKMLALIFSGGILAVITVFIIQYIWLIVPGIDPFLWIKNNISDPTYYYAGLFIMVGIMEELVKQMMLRYIDSKTVLIQTINDSIKFSLVAALGFAFAENIIYFKTVIIVAPIQEVVVTFLFRSIFTACAHMLFSGIFGYFFGIAKFSLDISKDRHWEGKVYLWVHLIRNTFKIPYAQAFKEYKILEGLLIAIILHATFDYMLQMNQILPVILLVILGYAYLKYLLNRKAGNLILLTDISKKKSSSMAKKDTDVVLQLVGMWFEQKKYVDVMHICERLLERDPDNNVVKLFKAKAMDKLDPNNPYRKILTTIFSKKRGEQEKNTIDYYRRKKEVEQKKLTKEKKEKLFRFIEDKKKEDEETFKINV
ncbi:PrsW family intramembrane metalloprotease [bacterium]|nr:PrsW family intramembrane metalloprotease [bacterium]